jgi:predicted DNA-binding transcriptional regulator AlpA
MERKKKVKGKVGPIVEENPFGLPTREEIGVDKTRFDFGKMQLRYVDVDSLKVSKLNPRIESVPTDITMEEFAENVKKFGLLQPIIVNENLEVLCGSLRLDVMRRLGWKEAPAYILNIGEVAAKTGLPREIVEQLVILSEDLMRFETRASEKGAFIEHVKKYNPNMKYKDIARLVGVSERTIFRWVGPQAPEYLKLGYQKRFVHLPWRKKKIVGQLLKSVPQEQHGQLIEYAESSTLDDVCMVAENIRNSLPVDFNWRKSILKNSTKLKFRVSLDLRQKFVEKCFAENIDPNRAIVELLEWVLEEENWKAFRAVQLTRVSEVVQR